MRNCSAGSDSAAHGMPLTLAEGRAAKSVVGACRRSTLLRRCALTQPRPRPASTGAIEWPTRMAQRYSDAPDEARPRGHHDGAIRAPRSRGHGFRHRPRRNSMPLAPVRRAACAERQRRAGARADRRPTRAGQEGRARQTRARALKKPDGAGAGGAQPLPTASARARVSAAEHGLPAAATPASCNQIASSVAKHAQEARSTSTWCSTRLTLYTMKPVLIEHRRAAAGGRQGPHADAPDRQQVDADGPESRPRLVDECLTSARSRSAPRPRPMPTRASASTR